MNQDPSGLADSRTTPPRKSRSAWVVIIVVVLVVGFLAVIAQPIHDPRWKGYLVQMKSDLVSLRTAEEVIHDSTGKYSDRPSPQFFTPTPGVDPPAITVTDTAWSATVTSVQFPEARCGIAVGMPNPVDRRAEDGEPACVFPSSGPKKMPARPAPR